MNKLRARKKEGMSKSRTIERSVCSYWRVKHVCESLCMSADVCVSVLTYEGKNE